MWQPTQSYIPLWKERSENEPCIQPDYCSEGVFKGSVQGIKSREFYLLDKNVKYSQFRTIKTTLIFVGQQGAAD